MMHPPTRILATLSTLPCIGTFLECSFTVPNVVSLAMMSRVMSPVVDDAVAFRVHGWPYLSRPLDYTSALDLPVVKESLVTCIKVQEEQRITATFLTELKQNHFDKDDAFSSSFLQRIIFAGGSVQASQIRDDATAILKEWGAEHIHYVQTSKLQTGPYYIRGGDLYSIWKVYDDHKLAFVQAVWTSASNKGGYEQVNTAGNEYRGHGIAVMPRSYASASSTDQSRNLRGLRLAIKDNFLLHGTRNTLGNRAYLETYPIQNSTADAVVRLVEAGAEVVGKTHMSAFAMMEHPMQSVDYQAPFNPRGDGYLIPGGSSSGSAVAVAAYDWVDIALCSDTAGSARIPALQTGVFGFRTSKSDAPHYGLLPAWPAMDTPGWLGRDLRLFPLVLDAIQPAQARPGLGKGVPTRILYPQDFRPQDSRQVQAMEDFLQDLCNATGCNWNSLSITDDWRNHGPVGERDLQTYLYNTTRHGWFYSAYHTFNQFRQNYRELHGHDPFVTEVVRWYWSLGKTVSSEQNEELMGRLSVFSKWVKDYYELNQETGNVFALHIDEVKPKYRDEYPGNSNPEVPGLRVTYLAPILRAPELALPIAQLPYQSRITGREEQLPVVVGLMGAPGTDRTLLEWTIKALQNSGRPVVVKTGREII